MIVFTENYNEFFESSFIFLSSISFDLYQEKVKGVLNVKNNTIPSYFHIKLTFCYFKCPRESIPESFDQFIFDNSLKTIIFLNLKKLKK